MTAPTRNTILVAVLAALVMTAAVPAANAGRVHVSGDVGIRVWVDDTWDVFPGYADVAISFVADRSCYATIYVVDTDGYLHVVYPFSRYDNAWVTGGAVYRYSAYDLGLDRLDGRGIAYVFAVGSPRPFDYTPWSDAVFCGGYGYRVYGDPFLASRRFYVSLFPASFGWEYVSVGYARFYVREWVRYPRYLCRGHSGLHVRVNDYCRTCAPVFSDYRAHVADPYRVIHPRSRVKFKQAVASSYAEIKRSDRAGNDRTRDRAKRFDAAERVRTRGQGRVQTPPRVKRDVPARAKSRVVSTSRSVRAARPDRGVRATAKPLTQRKVAGWKSTKSVKSTKSMKSTQRTARRTTLRGVSKPTRPSAAKTIKRSSRTVPRKAAATKRGGAAKKKR